jgi:hypothetical protein
MSIFTRVSNCWPIEKHFQSTAEKIPIVERGRKGDGISSSKSAKRKEYENIFGKGIKEMCGIEDSW